VTEADIETCQQADDCMVVPYSHCCSTHRAVHRAFQYLYSDTPRVANGAARNPV
jgi:hypothetical protein